MNKIYIISFFSAIILSSCSLVKKTNTENNLLNNIDLSEKGLIKKINSQNISPKLTSINSKIKINKEDQETRINAQIRIKKDSVIWISAKAPIGIEIFRIMITPDSIYYMSRIDKNYFVKKISYIKEVVKSDVSFIKIQEILFASPEITSLNSNKETYEILQDIFRVSKIQLKETENKKVSITYYDYKVFPEIGGLFFPEKVFVDVKSKEIFTAEIHYTKIKFNK